MLRQGEPRRVAHVHRVVADLSGLRGSSSNKYSIFRLIQFWESPGVIWVLVLVAPKKIVKLATTLFWPVNPIQQSHDVGVQPNTIQKLSACQSCDGPSLFYQTTFRLDDDKHISNLVIMAEKDDKNSSSQSSDFLSSLGWDSLTRFMDDQRILRLKGCEEVGKIYKSCLAKEPNRPTVESTASSFRAIRYYDWRGDEPGSCAREAHAFWACRAVSTRCGATLSDLRDCFRETGREKSLAAEKTGYESNDISDAEKLDIPCFNEQRIVGDCVIQNLQALEERVRNRK